jgi:KaiC/GvpD/RAD55 family RecA-like ATPase
MTKPKPAPKSNPAAKAKSIPTARPQLPKVPTGIQGLDEITGGGLPKGRPTLVCGGAGCGKTLLAMEFLVRGATQFNEPGVFMAFEETAQDLTQNVASLGFDLKDLVARKKIVLDFVYVERSEIEESGEYDLEGLFIRLGAAIDSIGAKRVVLDTIEALFAGLPNEAVLRAELRRLFNWLKEKGVTAVNVIASDWVGWSAIDTLNSLFLGQTPADSGIGWTLADAEHNIPASLSSMVGRTRELEGIRDTLRRRLSRRDARHVDVLSGRWVILDRELPPQSGGA